MKLRICIMTTCSIICAAFVFATHIVTSQQVVLASPITNKIAMNLTKSSIPIQEAEKYFDEAKAICDNDNGELWGKPLNSPMLFIDAETYDVVANEPDEEGLLRKKGNVYIGKFPANQNISNSTTDFGGKHWSMVSWPLPQTDSKRNVLLTHEMFHYQQSLLYMKDVSDYGYNNSHMDDMEARISIQLEWLALERAIHSEDLERKEAITDALSFRYARRQLFSSGTEENKFEIHEGLAEYTSNKLCHPSKEDLIAAIDNNMKSAASQPSFVRSFGYHSGLAYGFLLDEAFPRWRKEITFNSDLGGLLKTAYKIEDLADSTDTIKGRYSIKPIYDKELKIKEEKDVVIKDYIRRLVESANVRLDLDKREISFNPNNLQPIPELGTVYPNIKIQDVWGSLTVDEGGCLLSDDWSTAFVSARNIQMKDNTATGEGWVLSLHEPYGIKQEGQNYVLYKK